MKKSHFIILSLLTLFAIGLWEISKHPKWQHGVDVAKVVPRGVDTTPFANQLVHKYSAEKCTIDTLKKDRKVANSD